MLEGKTHVIFMYLDSVQLSSVLPHPQKCFLAILRPSVFLHLSSSCEKDSPYKDLVSLCCSKGSIWLM